MDADARRGCLWRSMASVLVGIVVCAAPFGWPSPAVAAQPARVAVFYSPQKSYEQAVATIVARVKQAGHVCVLVQLPKNADPAARSRALEQLADAKPSVVAASGATATVLALKAIPDKPVIFFMLPNALDAPFMAEGAGSRPRVAGVATDPSPKDHVDWITRLHPASRRIAVFHSAGSKQTVQAIKTIAHRRGVEILPIDSKKNEFPKAIEALNKKACDGVLMVPDAQVYNSPNVRRLLLWSLRHKKPVWAFSANIVKAGALAGLYAEGKVVGGQTARLIDKVIAGADVKAIGAQYPNRTGKAVNVRTAERIGVPLDGRIPKTGVVRYGEEK